MLEHTRMLLCQMAFEGHLSPSPIHDTFYSIPLSGALVSDVLGSLIKMYFFRSWNSIKLCVHVKKDDLRFVQI